MFDNEQEFNCSTISYAVSVVDCCLEEGWILTEINLMLKNSSLQDEDKKIFLSYANTANSDYQVIYNDIQLLLNVLLWL